MIQVIGKKSFVGKENKRFLVIYYGQVAENTEGLETMFEFVNEGVFSKVRINGKYNPVYGKSFNGKAYLIDVEPLN